jgi:hypothetical protein
MKKGSASEEAEPRNTRNQTQDCDQSRAATLNVERWEVAARRRPPLDGVTMGKFVTASDASGKSADVPSGVTASLASTETFHWTTSFQ